jgi:hypothetical protein
MEDVITEVIGKIEEQQAAAGEGTAPWMVGDQLKDICRDSAADAELIFTDLNHAEMSIVEAEKKIKAYADAHKKGGFSCVPPKIAEKILREFYGLPDRSAEQAASTPDTCGTMIDLAEFLG